jgi:hypothetical protein
MMVSKLRIGQFEIGVRFQCPDRLCGSPILLFIGHWGSFLGSKVAGACKLAAHLHLVPRLIMRGFVMFYGLFNCGISSSGYVLQQYHD